jgi:hypothetical protein
VILLAVGGVLMIAAVILTYYAISYAVLFLVGKAFPLAGRRRTHRVRPTSCPTHRVGPTSDRS